MNRGVSKTMPACLACKNQSSDGNLDEDLFGSEERHSFCKSFCRDANMHPKTARRVCAREGCKHTVPEGHRMLCASCYCNGENLGESVSGFDLSDRAHLDRQEEAIQRRIKDRVRIYSSSNMSQEELRALVPSLQKQG